MSEWIGMMPPVLPDIAAAAGLILLGIAFCRNRGRYRKEEQRLQEAIRSLQGGTELQDGADAQKKTDKRDTGHSGKGDL